MPTTIAQAESRLNQLIEKGQTEQAVELLCKMVDICARHQEFEKAENYRDQLYEVDSMALPAIVRMNEIIEAEKSKALTPGRRRLWARFFEELPKEEANAFFFALKEIKIQSDQTLLKQGKTNDRLYLIEKGRFTVVHEREDKQQLIQTIGAGDVIGEDTFFSINVCTASVISLSEAKLNYMEKERLEGILIQYPQIEERLKKVCGTGRKIYNWIRKKGMDRRAYKRINLNTRLWFQVLDAGQGKAMTNSVSGELWDISKCGLSFYFGSKNRQAVQRLIGRSVGVRFKLTVDGKRKEAALTGIVQGVQAHPLDEYSVHVKLRKQFSEAAMHTIHGAANME